MAEKNNVQTELEALQLEKTRREVQLLRSEESMRKVRRDSIELSLSAERERDAMRHKSCWHKKGGNGVENLFRGNDNNYAVVKHILPTGELMVVCQRCGCEWHQPKRSLLTTTAGRKQYMEEMAEYQKAVAFPTDNTTSGSQIFLITEMPTIAA